MTEPGTGNRLKVGVTRAASALRELVPQRFRRDRPVVPVLRLAGVIGISSVLRPGLTMAGVARSLDRLFGVRNAAAVALVINSPGGSPAQSHLIFRRIRDLAQENRAKLCDACDNQARTNSGRNHNVDEAKHDRACSRCCGKHRHRCDWGKRARLSQ